MAKKSSKTSELYAAAKMRLQDFLVASVGDDGHALSAKMRENIVTVINSNTKTYRYMLFVGLLVSGFPYQFRFWLNGFPDGCHLYCF